MQSGGEPKAKLGPTDTVFLVMGGMVGSGIFMNPHVVAAHAPSAPAILGAWVLGGGVALAAGFIWAELAACCPGAGGQYAYLREGIHPGVGFVYGWSNLIVTQTGGMAAVAMTFARYAHVLAPPPWSEAATAIAALTLLTAVNLLGVKQGGRVQSALMALKVLAILALIAGGLRLAPAAAAGGGAAHDPPGAAAFFAAMIAVMFAYGGWATATFVSAEIEDSTRTLPRALILGTIGVVLLYVGVNVACLRTLGVDGLAAIDAPASEVMRRALGEPGSAVTAGAIALSTLGFLAQGMLTYPRVYFAMARDGAFFRSLGRLHPRTGVPHVAIVLQGVLAILTTLSGTYEEILSWVVTVDFAFLALTAATLFAFRRRPGGSSRHATPGGAVTAAFFILVSLAVVAATFRVEPWRSALGWALVASGVPLYLLWRRRA